VLRACVYLDTFCVVFQVQSCGRLDLEPNRTKYIVSAGDTIEIQCLCNEERAVWYFGNGTIVPVGKKRIGDQPYYRKQRNGGILVVSQISKRNGVGLYRCEGGPFAKNVSVQLRPGIYSYLCIAGITRGA